MITAVVCGIIFLLASGFIMGIYIENNRELSENGVNIIRIINKADDFEYGYNVMSQTEKLVSKKNSLVIYQYHDPEDISVVVNAEKVQNLNKSDYRYIGRQFHLISEKIQNENKAKQAAEIKRMASEQ